MNGMSGVPLTKKTTHHSENGQRTCADKPPCFKRKRHDTSSKLTHTIHEVQYVYTIQLSTNISNGHWGTGHDLGRIERSLEALSLVEAAFIGHSQFAFESHHRTTPWKSRC